MAEARGVVDVVGAEEARRLLRRVVHLVGEAARREIEGHAGWIDVAQFAGDDVERFIPGGNEKTGFTAPADHRFRQPAQLTKLL